MLSPGKQHLLVPKGIEENYRYRLAILEQAKGDEAFQRGLLEVCKNDILFWINTFAWQFNPEHFGEETGPFLTWPFQEEAIRDLLEAIEDREDAVWQKSREVGASWLALMVVDWLCLFHPRKKALVVS